MMQGGAQDHTQPSPLSLPGKFLQKDIKQPMIRLSSKKSQRYIFSSCIGVKNKYFVRNC